MQHPAAERAPYFHGDRQNPARPSARPSATFLALRAVRFGCPDATALMLFEIRAARYSWLAKDRPRVITPSPFSSLECRTARE
jgi:hypothetical protein